MQYEVNWATQHICNTQKCVTLLWYACMHDLMYHKYREEVNQETSAVELSMVTGGKTSFSSKKLMFTRRKTSELAATGN